MLNYSSYLLNVCNEVLLRIWNIQERLYCLEGTMNDSAFKLCKLEWMELLCKFILQITVNTQCTCPIARGQS